MGSSEATFYVWSKRYRGIDLCEMLRLGRPVEKDRKLEQIVADLTLDKARLQLVVVLKG